VLISRQFIKICVLYVFPFLVFLNTNGQTNVNYIKSLNSLLPVSPNAASIIKYGEVPVNMSNGIPNITIPIFTVEESNLKVPISLSYNAGGIKVDEPATWVGLAWSLSAGGAITREVRGQPDDNEAEIGYFSYVYTNNYYLHNASAKVRDSSFKEASMGRLDLEPDMFYFNAAGLSGKFAFDQETNTFTCLPQQSVKISRDAVNNTWMLIGPDGTSYYFQNKELTTSTVKCDVETNNFNNIISTWYLSKIVDANRTDSVIFDYNYAAYDYYSAGSSTMYSGLSGEKYLFRPDLNCFSHNYFSGYSRLAAIRSRKHTVEFIQSTVVREDIKDDYALNRINIKSANGQLIKSFSLSYDYYNSDNCSNLAPDPSRNRKRLRLLSVDERGGRDTDAPLSHKFTYYSQPLPCRLSYSQDYWGYPNGAENTNPYTLVPKETIFSALPNGTVSPVAFPGADRNANEEKMKAGILTKIQYPTGGTTTFEYEANKIGYRANKYIEPKTVYKTHTLSDIKYNGEYLDNTYQLQFVINEPPSELNGGYGGVFASGSAEPMCDAANPTACGDYVLTGPQSKTFTNTFEDVYLPNGSYTLTASVSRINDVEPPSGFRYFSCSISYRSVDAGNGFGGNYTVGGLRIKRIINSDSTRPSAQNIREFVYHNPVNDSSYGKLLSLPIFNNNETVYVSESHPDGWVSNYSVNYLVRAGNTMIPYITNQGGYVFYPKVTENIIGTQDTQRTEHYFSYVPAEISTSYPFTPAYDPSWQRGNNEKSVVFRQQGGAYTPLQITSNNFNYNPLSASGQVFYRDLLGILSTNVSYNVFKDINTDFSTNMLEPTLEPEVREYYVPTGRFYKQSDTTVIVDVAGNKLTTVNSYRYGDAGQQLIEQRSTDSKGRDRIVKYTYPAEGEAPASHISQVVLNKMIAENRLNTPLLTIDSVGTTELKRETLHYGYQGTVLTLDSLRTSYSGGKSEMDLGVLQYDNYGNPLTIKQRDGLFRKYIWAKEKGILQASCVSASSSNIIFTSFESW